MKVCDLCPEAVWNPHSCYCAKHKREAQLQRAAEYRTRSRIVLRARQQPRNDKIRTSLHQDRVLALGVPLRCEICGKKFEPGNRQVRGPQWDHNHATGKGRGWLCRPCNTGLGSLGDNPAILKRAYIYLKSRGVCPTRSRLS